MELSLTGEVKTLVLTLCIRTRVYFTAFWLLMHLLAQMQSLKWD